MDFTLTRIDPTRGRAPKPPGINQDENYIIEQAVRKTVAPMRWTFVKNSLILSFDEFHIVIPRTCAALP